MGILFTKHNLFVIIGAGAALAVTRTFRAVFMVVAGMVIGRFRRVAHRGLVACFVSCPIFRRG